MLQQEYQKQHNIFHIQDIEVVAKSKSRHLIVMNHLKKKVLLSLKQKEDNWNNRFYVNQHEEQVQRLKQLDQISENLQPKSVKKQQSQERLRQIGTNVDEDYTFQQFQKYGRGNQRLRPGAPPLQSIIETEKDQIIKAFQNLKDLWNKQDIPNHHRDVFIQCMKTVSKTKALNAINQESEDLQNNKAYIQNCIIAIQTRENCLVKLSQSLDNLTEGVIELQIGVQQCSELITHLRILTINVVEQIVAWRQYFLDYLVHDHSYSSAQIPFMYKEENYLLKIKRDTSYLAHSKIANQFAFSNRSDPFFLALTNIQSNNSKVNDKIVQFTSKPLIKRMKVCEFILMNESTNEVSQDKSAQNKRGKIYEQKPPKQIQSPQRQLNIQPGKIRRTRDTSNHNHNPPIITNQEHNSNITISQASDIIDKSVGVAKQSQYSVREMEKNQKPLLQVVKDSSIMNNPQTSEYEQISKQDSAQLSSKQEQQSGQIQDNIVSNQQEQGEEQTQNHLIINNYVYNLGEIQDYMEKIDNSYQQTFMCDLIQINKQHTQGMDSFFLAINDKNNIQIGLAFFYMDKQCFNERRFFLSHFSILKSQDFPYVLKQVLEFFWENDPASELRISLYHYQQNEYYGANKEITSQLKEIGFKWKIVQQVNPDVRITIMALRRPLANTTMNAEEPIFLQNAVAFCSYHVKDKQNSITSPIVTACLMSKLNNSQDEFKFVSELNQIKDDLLSKEYDFKGIKYECQNGEDINNYMKKNFETSDQYHQLFMNSLQDEQALVQYGFLKACYRWKQCKLAIVNETNFLYTRLKNFDTDPEGSVFQLQSKDKTVYLISTDDPAINIFVYEIESPIPQEQFFQSVKLTLQDLESQIPIDQDLLIPQFIVNTQIRYQGQAPEQGLVNIGRFSTHYAPKLNIPDQFDRSMGIIMKPPYVFGVLNSDVTDLVNLPYLAFIVQDEDCISKNMN